MSGGHGLGLMAWQIAEGLKGRGHDVTFIAKEGSQFSGVLHMVDTSGYEGEKLLARDCMRLHRSWPFDAILDHGHLHVIAAMFPDVPVVNVFHDIYQEYARCPVLLSYGQQALMDNRFDSARIIHNALNKEAFIPNYTYYQRPFVLFMGALSEIKQPLLAIEACAYLGLELVLAGRDIIGKFPAGAYEGVQVVGAVAGRDKMGLLQNARVFLQLGTVESFGLTTVEAALCATPVVAWPAGGSVDIVDYGKNGVFVPAAKNSVQAVADAIERAWDISRQTVRDSTAAKFGDVDRQITAYEDVLSDCVMGAWW